MKRTIALVLTMAVGIITLPMHQAADAVDLATFRDEFNQMGYGGNDGDLDFSGPWQLTPAADHISISGGAECLASRCLKIGEKLAVLTPHGIRRGADLERAASATLSFQYKRQVTSPTPASGITVRGGSSSALLTTLATIPFDQSDDEYRTMTLPLDAHISDTTHIGFYGYGVAVDGSIYIDDVEIAADFGSAPIMLTDLVDRTDTEQDSVTISVEADDADGDPLTYSASGLPPTISIDNETGEISGTLSYSAAAGSPHFVTVTVSDGVWTDTDTFTWTVKDLNRQPNIDPPDDQITPEGQAWSLTIDATDPDTAFGDELTYQLLVAPEGMTIGAASGRLSWTPTEAQGPGVHPIRVRVRDSASPRAKDETSFTISVTEVNAQPTINDVPDQLSGAGDAVAVTLTASDPDIPANSFSYSATGLPAGLRVSGDEIVGVVGDAAGTHLVTVTVHDSGSPVRSNSTTFFWFVTTTNRAPILSPISDQTIGGDDIVRFTASAEDPDGHKVTYELSGSVPAGASINRTSGTFQWRPTNAQHGASYSVSVLATDDGVPNLSDSQEVQIDVPPVNTPPVVSDPGDQASVEGATVSLAIDASDDDAPPDTLEFTATSLPDGLGIDPTTGRISGTIGYAASEGSPYEVVVKVADDGTPSKSTSTQFKWVVADVNRPPVLAGPPSLTVATETSSTVDLSISDPDGDSVEVIVLGSTALGNVTIQDQEMLYVAGATPGSETIRLRAGDGQAFTFLSISVDVVMDNDPPIAVADAFETFTDEPLAVASPGVLGNDTDPDGDELAVQVISPPAIGEVALAADGSFDYVPPDGFVGRVEFEYEVFDGLEVDAATVRIRVRARAGIIDPADRTELIATRRPAPPDPPQTAARSAIVGRSFVALARSASIQVDMLGVPLALLAGLAMLALTIGRFGSTPFLYSRFRTGTLASLHEDGFGHIEGDDGSEYFVSVEALGDEAIEAGTRVRFRTISAEPRDLAVIVRLAG